MKYKKTEQEKLKHHSSEELEKNLFETQTKLFEEQELRETAERALFELETKLIVKGVL